MLNQTIKGLTLDSREVKSGDLFFAITGKNKDGRNYIKEAIFKGAAAVLIDMVDTQYIKSFKDDDNILIPYTRLKDTMGYIAALYYDEPSKHYPVIGITGTNGKTSCSHFIAQILTWVKKKCAIIGTLGAGFIDELEPLANTTPHAIQIQQLLSKFRVAKADAVTMEVTSIALEQKRVAGTHFDTVIFTNLTRDHLDYHQNISDYWLAKKELFLRYSWNHAVINLEDSNGVLLVEELLSAYQDTPSRSLIGYTTESRSILEKKIPIHQLPILLITTEQLSFDENGMHAFIKTPWGEAQLQCKLFGQFNLSNILASIAAACLQGIAFADVMDAIRHLKTVPGRMLTLNYSATTPMVIIDYAHTPDALIKVLEAVRLHCKGRIWCVYGCGGDRDRGKRPLMAAAVEQYSDEMIIAPDNPRTENIQQIFSDMLKGLKKPNAAYIEMDRKRAIEVAIEKADHTDVVVIAGKGHENIQIIQTQHIPFNDEEIARNTLQYLMEKR